MRRGGRDRSEQAEREERPLEINELGIGMIDTISLKHATKGLTEQRLLDLGAKSKPRQPNPTWYLNEEKGSPMPRITIIKSPVGELHVYTECSIPRLLYGHNARLPKSDEEIQQAVIQICTHVERTLGIDFDAKTATIAKIHLARDYQLGAAANRAWLALFDKRIRHFPKRNLSAEDGEALTLYFNGKSKRRNSVICIYPKHDDVLAKSGSQEALQASEGMLRIEYRANNPTGIRSLRKRLSIDDERELLTSDRVSDLFERIEGELNFPGCVTSNKPPMAMLLEKYPRRKARSLCGFLEERKLLGDAALRSTASERKRFNRLRRECEAAGVWLDHRQTEE